MTVLDDVLARLGAMPPAARQELAEQTMRATADQKWFPNDGPQTEAYFSKADVLLYGGQPGGGKSQLILGLAFNCHERTLIMRRQYGDLERLIDDALKINGSRDGFSGSPPPRLRISDKQVINFRAAQRIGDEQSTMGQGRDLLAIDEATHFAESQIRFLMGWVRTETVGQRCRTVLATNPPLTAEGLWVNQMFAPWLNPNYPNPAKAGELRWVISDDDGKDEWVDGTDDVRTIRGKVIRPTSRTYIPAAVKDNPYYAATDYERQLDAMPEPYRSMLMGGFQTAFKDADFQVIPTRWIEEAIQRWKEDGWKAYAMTAMAIDPAGGGGDACEIAFRHGGWYGKLITAKGENTADGSAMAAQVVRYRRDACPVVVDVGGGYGGAVMLRLKDNGINCARFDGASTGLIGKTKDGSKLGFANLRAHDWWRLREALNPEQEGGSPICLPPDPELRADLAAPTWELTARGILLESKDEIRKRLGRSPGKGDAVVMALSQGTAAVKRLMSGNARPKPELGYASLKKRR